MTRRSDAQGIADVAQGEVEHGVFPLCVGCPNTRPRTRTAPCATDALTHALPRNEWTYPIYQSWPEARAMIARSIAGRGSARRRRGDARVGVTATDEPGALGDLLRRHRLAAGLTQEALAEQAGLSARGIADLERGTRRFPYAHTMQRLVETLELT